MYVCMYFIEHLRYPCRICLNIISFPYIQCSVSHILTTIFSKRIIINLSSTSFRKLLIGYQQQQPLIGGSLSISVSQSIGWKFERQLELTLIQHVLDLINLIFTISIQLDYNVQCHSLIVATRVFHFFLISVNVFVFNMESSDVISFCWRSCKIWNMQCSSRPSRSVN